MVPINDWSGEARCAGGHASLRCASRLGPASYQFINSAANDWIRIRPLDCTRAAALVKLAAPQSFGFRAREKNDEYQLEISLHLHESGPSADLPLARPAPIDRPIRKIGQPNSMEHWFAVRKGIPRMASSLIWLMTKASSALASRS